MDEDKSNRHWSRPDAVADLVRMGLAAIGTAFAGIGGYLYYPPLGFAVAGVMVYAIAVIGSLKSVR